jgi:hypothetical protein
MAACCLLLLQAGAGLAMLIAVAGAGWACAKQVRYYLPKKVGLQLVVTQAHLTDQRPAQFIIGPPSAKLHFSLTVLCLLCSPFLPTTQGRDLERTVLAKAVRWHLQDRVVVHGNKTVVFE